jgi:hypothetical protein
MPLTPAHTAAAWPLSRLVRSMPLDALVVGTMVPDVEYFLELAPRGRFGHSPLGLLVFCLPVGVLTWTIYRHLVRPAILTLLPAGLRPGLIARHTTLAAVMVAILLGASSHAAWDSFTHAQGWGVQHIAALSDVVHLGGLGDVRIFKILQHVSTVAGIIVVAVWLWSWLQRHPGTARVYSSGSGARAVRILTLLLAVGAGGALLNGLRGISRGIAAGLGHAAVGGMAALAIGFLMFGLVFRLSDKGDAAT